VQKNEALAHERIQDTFRRFSETIDRYSGVALEIRGDALVAEFAKVSDSVSASLAFQTANITLNEQLSDDNRPVLRIGIAMGEVVVADNTVTGEGIVLAQRLEQLAEPGGVCIQGAAYDIIPKRFEFHYENLGEQHLKGFDEPVRAYSVVLEDGCVPPEPDASTPLSSRSSPQSQDTRPIIAILPFENMSKDPDQEYLSNAIAEDLVSALSRARWLTVLSRHATFGYKGQNVGIAQVAEELGARYIVDGSVRWSTNRIRVSAHLADASTGQSLWNETYDRDIGDLFEMQDDLSYSIAAAIEPELALTEGLKASRKGMDSLDAWGYYHRGLWHLYQFTEDSLTSAQMELEKAIGLDPEFASAYARLAYVLLQKAWYGPIVERESRFRDALSVGQRAIQLDDRDSVAHFSVGRAASLLGQDEVAISQLEEAIHLNPGSAQAYFGLGHAYVCFGNAKDGLPLLQTAIRMSPHDPHLWTFLHLESLGYYRLGNLEQSELAARRATQQSNATYWPFATLLSVLGNRDKLAECDLVLGELLRRAPKYSLELAEEDFQFTGRTMLGELLQVYLDGLKKAGVPRKSSNAHD
jgi:TolB-like protein